jgi:hypothetical protein
VRSFSPEEIREIFASLLAKYYHASGKARAEPEACEDSESDVDDYSDMHTVVDTFTALFCEHEEFETEDAAHQFLSGMKSEDDQEMRDRLHDWAIDLIAEVRGTNEVVDVEASTPESLLYNLESFTHIPSGEDRPRTPALWPVVSVIDFGLDHSLLEHIIFVDTAGSTDANSTRAENAKKQHKLCQARIVVADISRAKDDMSLRQKLKAGYRSRGSGNTILILSRADSIDADTTLSGSRLEKATELKLKDEIERLRGEKNKLRPKLRGASVEERYDIEESIGTLSRSIDATIAKLRGLRLNMRNRAVLEHIKKQYKDLTRDARPLPAFALGNEDYKMHQAGYSVDQKPAMSVAETGVPAARHRLFFHPTEGQLNEALHLANVQLPSVINYVELYCSRTHMDRKDEIEKILRVPMARTNKVLKNATEKFEEEMRRTVLNPMKVVEVRWTKQARALCKAWGKKHVKDQLSILKRHGHKQGRGKNATGVNWNAELIGIGEGDVEQFLHNLTQSLPDVFQELEKTIGGIVDETRMKIKSRCISSFLEYHC